MIIKNGNSVPLNANPGTLPQVSVAMMNWFQTMVFGYVTKVVADFQVVETMVEITGQGVMQPFKERDLMIKPEGQRAWSWWWLHCLPGLDLPVDNVVIYLGRQYRVMSKKNYDAYGYTEFQLVTDWTGSGPEEVSP